jgi:hypothetical protein
MRSATVKKHAIVLGVAFLVLALFEIGRLDGIREYMRRPFPYRAICPCDPPCCSVVIRDKDS